MLGIIFIIFGGLAIGCAISLVVQRNPLYSAISLIGVFIALAGLYVTLSAPFIAAVQVIVYAGAIMVLVIFVIMLLNVEAEEPHRGRLRYLVPLAVVLAAVLIAESAFILFSIPTSPNTPNSATSNVGMTASIGVGLFTKYLLPFEITSVLLLMAIVGAMSLAKRSGTLGPNIGVVPGAQVLPMNLIDPEKDDSVIAETDTTAEAARLLGVESARRSENRD